MEQLFTDKRIAFVGRPTALVAKAIAAMEYAGALVQTAEHVKAAPALLMCHDVDLLLIGNDALQEHGLAFVKEIAKLWPWLEMVVIGDRLHNRLKAELEWIGISHFLINPHEDNDIVQAVACLLA